MLAGVTEHWSPRTIAVVNDYDARVVKVKGEFTRHSHPETDEFFLVLSAASRSGWTKATLCSAQATCTSSPRQVHQPYAGAETTVLLFEPSETVNTGDTPSELTAQRRLA